MDERSQQGQHAHQQQLAPQHAPISGQHAPWPQQLAQPAGAPIAGHAPYPGPATHQQFQYAGGFVLPGASSQPGMPAPMSAHGGTIGSAQPQLHHQQAPQQYAAPMAPQQAAVAIDPAAQPQAWAFPTANGLQLVHPSTMSQPSHAQQHHHQQLQYQQQPQQYLQPVPPAATVAPSARRRVRWETIVPTLAVACLVASIAFFISDFDKMTGRDAGDSSTAAPAAASTEASDDAAVPADSSGVVAQAKALLEQGRFDDAANLLHPVLDVESPDPAAVALNANVDVASRRNDALLTRLATQRRAKQWTGVIGTIQQLEQVRPLSKDLVTLRANARKAVVASRTMARARALMADGRYSQAAAMVDQALKAGPNGQLQALREQISARQAAPSTRSGDTSRGGGTRTPPASGGRTTGGGGATTPRPPANVPSSSIPDVPKLPNTSGAGSASAVTGGGPAAGAGGSNCHVHDGVQSCHD